MGTVMTQFVSLLFNSLTLLLFALANLVGILLIPFGLPGTLLQVLAAALLAAATNGERIGWIWVGIFLAIAMFGEAADFLSGQWGTKQFGGSRSASIGALLGGIIGAMIGAPIPLIGPIVASFAGTFAGAILGELHAQKKLEGSLKAGMGAVLGRAIGTALKFGLGILIALLSIIAILH